MKGTRGRSRTDSDTRGPASAAVVFAVLAGVVVLLAGAAVLLIPDPRETPIPATSPATEASSPDLSLTDEEAIERLHELDGIRIRALEERDPRLLKFAFSPDSPALRRVRSSIRTLLRDGVLLEQRQYVVRESEVVMNGPAEIRIRQEVLVHVEFEDEAGNRLTQGPGKERQELITTLKRVGEKWLFFDGRIVDTAPL